MSVRAIFLDARERKDPADRAAFLDRACAGDPALRRRVEALLRSSDDTSFLNVTAVDQLTIADRSLAFLAPPREPGSLGRLDHFEVQEVLGRGGMGVVLRAHDTKLRRDVALKALAPHLAASRGARDRFVHEAQLAAQIRDEHVVAVHAVSDDGPVPYLVMEYVGGITLEHRLRPGRPLGLEEVVRIGHQAARGLAAAHAHGLVHRDVKPSNLLLQLQIADCRLQIERQARTGTAPRGGNDYQSAICNLQSAILKISDFGLALAPEDAGTARAGAIAGTPAYMSPQQARGEPIDYRSDLFSLGSVLYALCTGRLPFRGGETAEVLKSVCEDTPTPIREINPDIPTWLCDLIAGLHAKEPERRFGGAREVAAMFAHYLTPAQGDTGIGDIVAQVRPEDRPLPSAPRVRRPIVTGLFGLAILVGLCLVLVPWWLRGPGRSGLRSLAPPELRREDIPPELLTLAGAGDPARAPPELVAVLGGGKFLLPRVGQTAWLEQRPDGEVLAVPLDEDVVLFEAATGRYLRSLQGPGHRVFSLAFSPDNRLLAAATRSEAGGGAVRVWDLPTDRALFTNPQPGPTVSCAVTFGAGGERLFTEADGRVHVYDAHSGQLLQQVPIHPSGIAHLRFSPDGRRLAVAGWQADAVKLLDWAAGRLAETGPLLGHPQPVTAAVFSPDGKFLASSDEKGFKVWDADTLVERFSVGTPAGQLTFTPDSRTLFATTTTDQHKAVHTFTRWDVVTGKQLPALSVDVAAEPVRAFHQLSRDGKVLFVTPQHDATYVKVIDTGSGKEWFPRTGHVAPLGAVAVSPDGRTVASAGDDWAVKLWDLATGRVLHSLSAHTATVYALAFSPDGKQLASGSRDGTIALWDVSAGTELRALHGQSRSPSRIQFSPDGRTLAAGGEGGVVKFWDVATGKEGRPLPGHTGPVRGVAYSPDSSRLASGGQDQVVRLHDLAAGGVTEFPAPGDVSAVAFAADGRTLAAIGSGVRFWDLETGQETSATGHTGPVHGVAFSPTTALLATGGDDGTVRFWRPAGGAPVRVIGPGPFGGPVRSVAFTPDGRYLVTANANGTLYVLSVPAP
jgi:WD40 repeat protein/serine/threonine protein kinase